jgi:hypothetical protein
VCFAVLEGCWGLGIMIGLTENRVDSTNLFLSDYFLIIIIIVLFSPNYLFVTLLTFLGKNRKNDL